MYAVEMSPMLDKEITTLCWPATRATLPSTPIKGPSITLTISPPLKWHWDSLTNFRCSLLLQVARMKFSISLHDIVNGGFFPISS